MRMKSTVTIRDVANKAGVSVSTVSRVLNHRDGVSEETGRRVQEVIAELNYTSSLAARSMRSRCTHILGLIVPDLVNAYSSHIIRGVNAAVKQESYDLLVYPSSHHWNGDCRDHERCQVALLNSGITDGTIVVTPQAASFPLDYPIVVIDPNGEGTNVPSIISTNYIGTMDVMDYLVQLGHRRIGFVSGRADLYSAIRRFQGYVDGLAEHDIPFDETLVAQGDYTWETGYHRARRLLGLANSPTAIFAANDQSAMGVMEAARDLGLSVPQALSVVGFDNVVESGRTTPKLTTVDQSLEAMGYLAVQLVLELVRGKPIDGSIHRLPTRLIVRDSCQPPPSMS
jgi:LacI family transcriptional regulator